MALTYGFYNSLNHDRKYDSLQLSRIFDGIINDGVYESIGDALMVKASNAMSVSVGLGRAWFNHTWTLNDALYLVTITDAELALNRYDAVVLEVDSGNRTNSIKVVKGTPAVNPVKPTLITSDTVNQHPLAYIYVKAKATEITQANIQNAVGTSECPFVTGIMSTISVDNLIQQWSAEFNVLFAELEDMIAQAASQTLIDKSVTEPKIANNAVVTRTVKDKAVTMEKLADHAVSVVKSFQLPTTGWTRNSGGVYEANVTVSGLKTTDTVVLGLQRGTVNPDGWTMTLDAFDSDQETFSKILAGRITAANTLHLYAKEAITNDIYLNCWVVSK